MIIAPEVQAKPSESYYNQFIDVGKKALEGYNVASGLVNAVNSTLQRAEQINLEKNTQKNVGMLSTWLNGDDEKLTPQDVFKASSDLQNDLGGNAPEPVKDLIDRASQSLTLENLLKRAESRNTEQDELEAIQEVEKEIYSTEQEIPLGQKMQNAFQEYKEAVFSGRISDDRKIEVLDTVFEGLKYTNDFYRGMINNTSEVIKDMKRLEILQSMPMNVSRKLETKKTISKIRKKINSVDPSVQNQALLVLRQYEVKNS